MKKLNALRVQIFGALAFALALGCSNPSAFAQVTAPLVISTPSGTGVIHTPSDAWTCETTCSGKPHRKAKGSKTMTPGEQFTCAGSGAHPQEAVDALTEVLKGKTKVACECKLKDLQNAICKTPDGITRSYSQLIRLWGNAPNGEKGVKKNDKVL